MTTTKIQASKSSYRSITSEEIKDNFVAVSENFYRFHFTGDSTKYKDRLEVFEADTGTSLNYQTFKQFMQGKRFNISFAFIFSQYIQTPLTKILGNVAYANEQKLMFKDLGLIPIDAISSPKVCTALPATHINSNNVQLVKQMELPNDVTSHKSGSLCLVDVSYRENRQPGIYLMREGEELKAVELNGDGQTKTVGRVCNILAAV
ncbi:hypothetical protein [Pseudoalteromonas galatheae]|uniref:hypothetical protein n=2 Tax=Pseudoalteromonas galatheae TaxID=579562 RepID=UPI0030CCF574